MQTLQVILLLASGAVTGAIIVALFIRPRLRKLHRKIITDSTSGLPNYEGFLAYLKKNRFKDSYVLFLLDLDNFRRFNRQGYDTGDEVLKFFAAKLSEAIIGTAICARYRLGDEFIVVARSIDKNEVIELLEKLTRNVIYRDDVVSFSYGFAPVEVDDYDGSVAIKTAHAMLIARRS